MTTLTLQQAFEACQKNETAWLNRKAELAAAEQEYQEQVLAGDDRIPAIMQELRDIIDVKKWEINQALCGGVFFLIIHPRSRVRP
ncbi:phage polarity suppression protein, partial [Klebsiella pneumoniae]|uniref:phage polarity suppression protein n=1 Tax=Klebsiella pneumoniae TaxID=573 RepID=UPI00406AB0E2